MSFLRPEAVRFLSRWAETATLFAMALLLFLYVVIWSGMAGPLMWGIAAFVALASLWVVRSAVLSALGNLDGDAPGVVQIDERQIAYFGPHQGGIISINDIHTIEIATAAPDYWQYDTQWILRWSETEGALIIPVTAQGAGGLLDALSALPGFAPTRALSALAAAENQTITIWQRAGTTTGPALAHMPPRD
ncbi:MAG: hypothetical protein AAF367_06045 [Pseudomonadota bacterium]